MTMDATQQDTATRRREHSCEAPVHRGDDASPSCSDGAANVSARRPVRELGRQPAYSVTVRYLRGAAAGVTGPLLPLVPSRTLKTCSCFIGVKLFPALTVNQGSFRFHGVP